MHFILILLPQKSIWWRQPAIGAEVKDRVAVFSRKTLFFVASCSCSSSYFSTDLALYICSHNSEVWQRLMASNLVSLAKTWHFHMGHWVNMFERERGERDKSWVCVSMHPPVLPTSCCKPWHSISTKCTPRCTVALTERRGGQSVLWMTQLFYLRFEL